MSTFCFSNVLPLALLTSSIALVIALQALMTLFVLASKDGWVNIMYRGLDSVGVDMQVEQRLTHS